MVEVIGNLYLLYGGELLFAERFVTFFPEMQSYHDMLVGYSLFAHDEAALLAYGVQACGIIYCGLVPTVNKGYGSQLVFTVADDDSLGYVL